MPKLTDAAVRAATPDPLKVTRRWDGDGLHLEVRPNGSKLWIFKYSFHGRQRRMSFGVYPAVGLKEARHLRDDARQRLRQGVDPQVERKEQQRLRKIAVGTTVQAVAEEWFSDKAPTWTAAYADDARRAFELHVFPRIGKRPIADVQSMDLLHVLRAITAAGERRELARRLRQKLEQIWNFAIITGRATVNAAAPLKKQIAPPVVQGFAAVPLNDLADVLLKIRTYGNRWVEGATLLQIFTATRPGETRGARWEEFDLDANRWTIPAERMKRRRAHIVPLSTQARQVLDWLQPASGHLPVLFPSRSQPTAVMSENTIGVVFQRLAIAGTPHGWRKVFSTWANEAGHRADVVEACLAHVDGTVRGVYNLAEHLRARRELLQAWGDHVEALCRAHAEAIKIRPIFPLT